MSRITISGLPSQLFSARLIFRKKQAGATLVEFAFGLIFFFSLLFGIVGFSHGLYAYHFVNHMAKEAARWAAVNGHSCNDDGSCDGTVPMNNGPSSSADVNTYVKNHAAPGIDPAKLATSGCGVSDTSACPDSTPAICGTFANYPGCTVQVKVAYAFNFVFPLLPTSTTTTPPCTQPGFCFSSTSEMVIAH
jgi:Flp pilus assembly protein TadG